MEKDLIKFYNNLSTYNKDITKYEDEKGNILLIPKTSLYVNCEYKEIEKEQMNVLQFEGKIDKDKEYEKINSTKLVSKYEITKIEADKYTLIDKEIVVSKVWFIRNGLGMIKSYNSKEEAVKDTNELNNKVESL